MPRYWYMNELGVCTLMESLLRTFLVGNLKINSHTPGFLIETVPITVYMDIQNDIHKNMWLFSIKSHTCTFLPSVVTGIISLQCLNDNNEKRFLFVCFGGERHSRSLDVGSIHVHDLKLLLLIESVDEKNVFFFFISTSFLLYVSLSL